MTKNATNMHAIKHLFHIEAPKSKVFKALTTIEGLSNWWTTDTSGSTEIGDIIQFRFGPHGGPDMKVTKSEPGKLVEWKSVNDHGWLGHIFRFELDENDGKTRVRFSHNGWTENDDFYAICSFSWARYMESLRQLCQTEVGQAYGSSNYV